MIHSDFLCDKYCYITYINIASDQKFELEIDYDSFDDFLRLANSGLCDIESGDTFVSLTIYN